MSANAVLLACAGAVAIAVALAVAWPLLRPRDRARAAAELDVDAHDARIYRDQLEELDRDRDRGLIGDGEFEAAKLEIERRLLSATDAATGTEAAGGASPSSPARILIVAVLVCVPVASLGLYAMLGSPELPGVPYAGRSDIADRDPANLARSLQQRLQELTGQLSEEPDNVFAWLELGAILQQQGRSEEAVNTLERARSVTQDHPAIRAGLGEAMVRAAGGMVTPAAATMFEGVLRDWPDNPRAGFFLGLADQQAGRNQAALDRWNAVLARSRANSPWVPELQRRITDVAQQLGQSPDAVMAQPLAAAQPGPSQEQVEAMANASPEEREAMIRSMVEGLAERLKETPDDVAGWIRLARAYAVLGDEAKEAQALDQLLALLPPDESTRALIERRRNELRAKEASGELQTDRTAK